MWLRMQQIPTDFEVQRIPALSLLASRATHFYRQAIATSIAAGTSPPNNLIAANTPDVLTLPDHLLELLRTSKIAQILPIAHRIVYPRQNRLSR